MKKLIATMLLSGCLLALQAQDGFWSAALPAGKITTHKAIARASFPTDFKLMSLNESALRSQLFTVVDRTAAQSTLITLPNAEGQLEQFRVYEASNFEPDLQAQFPEIRAFSGKGITDKYATVKLSFSPQGLQTMVFRTGKDNEFIEPYSADHSVYAVFKSQRKPGSLPWTCSTPEQDLTTSINEQVNSTVANRSGDDLKTMRLAQSCNAEYANYFGATSAAQVGLVLAAFNATLTRCNGVYERDLALHLNLVAASTSVIYYNPSTDPYSTTLSSWNLSLQQTLTANIGNANYDIGHMFGKSGGGGNAGCIGCVCVNPANNNSLAKGAGITSPADGIPQGDNFDIDYVAHEVGHQLGANHTFSYANEGTGVNKEIGSGITVMGYAGITSYDVANHSIEYFHQASIAQIQSNLAGKTCPVTTNLGGNATPVVSAVSNYTIPISTPFALTGAASDADGDALTYSWEQNDNSTTTGANSKASPTKTTGPNWLSFAPSSSPTRLFPRLETILAGGLTTGPLTGGDAGITTEALSSVSRTLNFRLTVRDNAPYMPSAPVSVGQTQFTDMVVTVSNSSGPFAVTAPNTNVSWAGNSSQTVTWSVNNTTAAPVSCANVKISLSTDGGQTFPTVLIASTANDGSETITVPNTPTGTARIKVEAVGNIFFDISNTNFTITAGGAVCNAPAGLSSSAITTSSATVSWGAVSGASSYAVDYKLSSSGTWISAETATTSTSDALTGLNAGSTYDWRVRTNCSSSNSSYTQAQFTTTAASGCGTAFEPNESISAAALISAGVANSAAITTSSDNDYFRIVTTGTSNNVFTLAGPSGVDYDLTIYNSGGTSIGTGTSGSANETVSLSNQPAGTYYIRVFGYNGANSATCYTITATVTPVSSSCQSTYDVSTNGTASGAATIPFNTDIKGLISPSGDNDYYKFVITSGGTATVTLTTLPGDYDLVIYSSNGTTQLASSTNGGSNSETITRTYTAGTYYARVYGYNNANSATICYTLKVQLGTASKPDFAGNEGTAILKMSPNPTSNILNISLLGADVSKQSVLQVMDARGMIVIEHQLKRNTHSIDVSKLSAGTYVVKISNGRSVITSKFVKN